MQLIGYVYYCQSCGHKETVEARRGTSMLHRCSGLTIVGDSTMLREMYEDDMQLLKAQPS